MRSYLSTPPPAPSILAPSEPIQRQAQASQYPANAFISVPTPSLEKDRVGYLRAAQLFGDKLNTDKRAKQRERMCALRLARKLGKLRQYAIPDKDNSRIECARDITHTLDKEAKHKATLSRINNTAKAKAIAKAYLAKYPR